MSTPEGDELNRLVAEAKNGGPAKFLPQMNWATSLDSCAELRKGLTQSERVTYMNALRAELGKTAERNHVGTPLVTDFDCVNASAEAHSRAFLKAKGVV